MKRKKPAQSPRLTNLKTPTYPNAQQIESPRQPRARENPFDAGVLFAETPGEIDKKEIINEVGMHAR